MHARHLRSIPTPSRPSVNLGTDLRYLRLNNVPLLAGLLPCDFCVAARSLAHVFNIRGSGNLPALLPA